MTRGKKILIFVAIIFLIVGYLYRFSPRRIEFLGHYNKVFAHRVNSLEKQKEALSYFNGIELDLVYSKEKNVFDINHPPAKSIGLTFETYLSQIEPNNFPFLWLDLKNLDTINNNDVNIFLRLNNLLETRHYPKNKILIETRHPEVLPKFAAYGYKTSYYLKRRLHQRTGKDLNDEISHIKTVLETQPKLAISSSYEDYTIMKTYFPTKTKYIWAIASPYKFKYNEVRTILEDEKVAIVLTKFRSLFGDR